LVVVGAIVVGAWVVAAIVVGAIVVDAGGGIVVGGAPTGMNKFTLSMAMSPLQPLDLVASKFNFTELPVASLLKSILLRCHLLPLLPLVANNVVFVPELSVANTLKKPTDEPNM